MVLPPSSVRTLTDVGLAGFLKQNAYCTCQLLVVLTVPRSQIVSVLDIESVWTRASRVLILFTVNTVVIFLYTSDKYARNVHCCKRKCCAQSMSVKCLMRLTVFLCKCKQGTCATAILKRRSYWNIRDIYKKNRLYFRILYLRNLHTTVDGDRLPVQDVCSNLYCSSLLQLQALPGSRSRYPRHYGWYMAL